MAGRARLRRSARDGEAVGKVLKGEIRPRGERNVVHARSFLDLPEQAILRKYGYPPDKQEKATATILQQAEVLSAVWAMSV